MLIGALIALTLWGAFIVSTNLNKDWHLASATPFAVEATFFGAAGVVIGYFVG